ncbi:type I restriction endonuclease subunit R [Almyronema epifaneia]|uniref:Type I restriction endonuclease subunit R n=1 Tax=Almyronema epifaneia S1 TaxID=2991925 RepID=A0ABW6IJR8_9CYAN
MATTIAVTQAITSLNEAHDRLHLGQATDEAFFTEWQDGLPELTAAEVAELTHLKDRYLYYVETGEISEGTANIIMVSPLLDTLGLCDPPYRIRGEQWMRLALETDAEAGSIVLEGRIDALTLQDNLWLVVVEGKRGGFSVLQGIPQTLAYMMGTPTPERAVFGLVTNGYDYLFLKLVQTDRPRYALSHNFTLLSDENNNLLRVARVLKRLASLS